MGSKKKNHNGLTRQIINGIKTAIKEEFSIKLILGTTAVTFLLAGLFSCTPLEWAFLVLFYGVMFAVELMNSAIEMVVDLKTSEYHPFAKIAKDTSSAAEGVIATFSILGTVFLFFMKF